MGSSPRGAMAQLTLSTGKCLLPFALAFAFLLFLSEVFRPALLLVGDVTVDVVDGKKAVGGAIAYAAAVASAYGVKACVVTAAGPDADLEVFRGHELHVVPTNSTLTFEHTYTWWGNKRKLKVTASSNMTLTMQQVPQHCRRARTLLLGPLTPQDLDAASFINFKQGLWDRLIGFRQAVGLMAQGQQRGVDATGKVFPFKDPSPQLLEALGPRTSVFLSDVETDSWPPGLLDELAGRSARWLITRGEAGAHEYSHGGSVHLPPEKVEAVDTNGAGDTFATAYMLALARHARSPGADANWVASRAVIHAQACKPQCVLEGIVLGSSYAQYRQWLRGKVDSTRHRVEALLAAIGPFRNGTQQAFAAFMTNYQLLGKGKRAPNGTAGLAVGASVLEGYAAAFNGSQKVLESTLARLKSTFGPR